MIRSDAGNHLGVGHVMRCLSLADELADRGASVVFAASAPAALIERIRANGHTVEPLNTARRTPDLDRSRIWSVAEQHDDAAQVVDVAGDDFDVVIVDHYGLSAAWETHFSQRSRLLAIDDLANRPHAAHIVTDQNWYGPGSNSRYDTLVGSDTVQLLGPRYAVLQRDYRRIVRQHPARFPPERLLVSFGGTDPGGETEKVLTALEDEEFDSLTIDVVMGSTTGVSDAVQTLVGRRYSTHLHVAIPSLAPLLARADLALGASGAATWERMAAGVPAMVTTVAPHQSGVTSALHDDGVTRWLGLVQDTTPSTYQAELRRALRQRVGWSPRIIDGFGAGRLAEALIPSLATDLRRRPLEPADAGAVLGLEAEHLGDAGSDNGLLGGPPAWRRESSRFDALINASANAEITEASGVPIAVSIDGRQPWIQQCVTHPTLRRAVADSHADGVRRSQT
jgi:UDP-2,4-diacetamido-2,4,6-trideoxy-beta-L-altropyranose hydrolase